MTRVLPDYLAGLYRLEELEGWTLLKEHLELTSGFSFVVILAPDDWGIAYIRSQLPTLLGSPNAIVDVIFDPNTGPGALSESLLTLQTAESTQLIWIAAEPTEIDALGVQEEAWAKALARLNRYRNTIQAKFHCTLVLAGPMRLQEIARDNAPDFWSIRSAIFRLEPIGTAKVSGKLIGDDPFLELDRDGVAGDPGKTLAAAERLRGKPGKEIILAQLLQRAGKQAERKLNWEVAIRCFEEAHKLEEAHGGDPELRFKIANDLSRIFGVVAEWDRGLHYAKRALEIAERYFGTAHPNTAMALNNLAQRLKGTNRLAEAERLMRRALAIDEQNFGADHPTVAIRLNNLASLLQATNRLAEAEPLKRRALAINEQNFGKNHPKVTTVLSNLAYLLQATNRLAEAEPLLRRALAIDEQSFGGDHPNVAIRLNNLASLLQATNRLAEAEPLMRRALAIDEQSFGRDHPTVAIRLNNLASLLQATNRLEEAEPLKRRALAIGERSFGADHPYVATVLNNLAHLLQATNRLAEAEPLMRRALAIDERSYGADHPEVATDLNNLAQLLKATNRLAEAEPLMRRALAIGEQSFGKEHPTVSIYLNNLAQLLKDTNRLGKAESLLATR